MHQKLTLQRLQDLLAKVTDLRVAVFGDFVLDQTLVYPQGATEHSIPVDQIRYGLGGAGRIVQLLSGLGVRAIRPFGLVGNDGFGWQMMRMLQPHRCDLDDLCAADQWPTPVSIQWRTAAGLGPEDTSLPAGITIRSSTAINKSRVTELLQHFAMLAPHVDLVVVYDAFPEKDRGLFSPYVRGVISEIAAKVRKTRFLVDSNHFVAQYTNMVTKVTANQLLESSFTDSPRPRPASDRTQIHVYEELQGAAMKLRRQTLRPVMVSLGEKGILTCDGSTSVIPSLPLSPPVDRTGFSDSITAVAALALACDASTIEAAQMAMLAANVVMHQKTHPTTVSRPELVDRFQAIDRMSRSHS